MPAIPAANAARDSMVTPDVKALKAGVKRQMKLFRGRYARTFHSFTAEMLGARLRALGLAEGDTALVHSSYDAFDGFAGKPTDVLALLQQTVGPTGVLMMPTMAFTGTAVDHVARHPVFDVVRTPSRMGLLSELLRRSPGVTRSVHPTHPVALWGAEAATLADGHYLAATPCGAGTPFARLYERDGKILLLGAGIDSLTFYHWVEEALEARLPRSPFTRQTFLLHSKLADGSTLATTTRLFEPAVSRRRNLGKLVPELRRIGALHETRIGRLAITLLSARAVHAAASNLADRGIYCYD